MITKVKNVISIGNKIFAKGKLIFKESQHNALFSITPYNTISLNVLIGKGYEPIIISETEKIEVGDYFIGGTMNLGFDNIEQCKKKNDFLEIIRDKDGFAHTFWKKILVLPENFSQEQLQMIVEGRLKDGDEVLVECEEVCPHYNGKHIGRDCSCKSGFVYIIKLNSQNQISLQKVEENNWNSIIEEYNRKNGKIYDTPTLHFIAYLEENFHPSKRK